MNRYDLRSRYNASFGASGGRFCSPNVPSGSNMTVAGTQSWADGGWRKSFTNEPNTTLADYLAFKLENSRLEPNSLLGLPFTPTGGFGGDVDLEKQYDAFLKGSNYGATAGGLAGVLFGAALAAGITYFVMR